MFFSFMIDYIKFLSMALFTCDAKKLLYELNPSDKIRSETLSLLLWINEISIVIVKSKTLKFENAVIMSIF